MVGTGYLGATHAVCMAALGYDVLGVDVDADKVRSLAEGRVPFFEPGLPEKLREAEAAGRLRFTTDFDEAAAFADVHFICVGTPQQTGSVRRRPAATSTRPSSSSPDASITTRCWSASRRFRSARPSG